MSLKSSFQFLFFANLKPNGVFLITLFWALHRVVLQNLSYKVYSTQCDLKPLKKKNKLWKKIDTGLKMVVAVGWETVLVFGLSMALERIGCFHALSIGTGRDELVHLALPRTFELRTVSIHTKWCLSSSSADAAAWGGPVSDRLQTTWLKSCVQQH